MEELFPLMLQNLSTASEKIQDYLANSFNGITSPLTEEEKDEYVDAMYKLRNGLIQLNSFVHIEYEFDHALTGDIENYSKLLQEYRSQLEELVGYLLDRGNAFPDDPFAKNQSLYLEEIIKEVLEHGNTLNKLLAFV